MEVYAKQINLTALQRIDPKIIHIIDNASQVVLYEFNVDNDKWVDMEIEGSLFIYKRSEIPYHGIVIMNRMNTTNLVEPFVRGLEFKKQEPYLLYKNKMGHIYCTWFYEIKDYFRVVDSIQRIIHSMKGKAKFERKRSSSESAKLPNPKSAEVVPDVITILNQAQEEYNKKHFMHNGITATENEIHPSSNQKIVCEHIESHLQIILPKSSSRHRSLSNEETSKHEELNTDHPIFVKSQFSEKSSEHNDNHKEQLNGNMPSFYLHLQTKVSSFIQNGDILPVNKVSTGIKPAVNGSFISENCLKKPDIPNFNQNLELVKESFMQQFHAKSSFIDKLHLAHLALQHNHHY